MRCIHLLKNRVSFAHIEQPCWPLARLDEPSSLVKDHDTQIPWPGVNLKAVATSQSEIALLGYKLRCMCGKTTVLEPRSYAQAANMWQCNLPQALDRRRVT